MKDRITIVEGDDLKYLLMVMGKDPTTSPVWRLRIWQSADAAEIKVKVNEGTWTPAIGEKNA